MKPTLSLLDGMKYVSHDCTDVRETWMRFGWEPTLHYPLEKWKARNLESDYEYTDRPIIDGAYCPMPIGRRMK